MRWTWVIHEARTLIDSKAAVAASEACQVHTCANALLVCAYYFRISLVLRRAVLIREVHVHLARCGNGRAVVHLETAQDIFAGRLLLSLIHI